MSIPSKIKGLIRRVAHNRIQPMDNLKKKNIIPILKIFVVAYSGISLPKIIIP